MANKTYWEKLKDPRWQKKRLEAMQRTDFTCEICGDSESTLNVHHKQYFKGREPWEYDISQLSVLCEECHRVTHEVEDPLNIVCSHLPMDGPQGRGTIASLIDGVVDVGIPEPFQYDPVAYMSGRLAKALFLNYCKLCEIHEVERCSLVHADDMFNLLLEFSRKRNKSA